MSADDDFIVEGEQEDNFIVADDTPIDDDSDEDIIEMLEESERVEEETKGEWAKFLVLAVIMLGTIGVVWLAIPVIFGQIVPAVMNGGSDEPTMAEVEDGEQIDEENSGEETGQEESGEEASGEANTADGTAEESGEANTEDGSAEETTDAASEEGSDTTETSEGEEAAESSAESAEEGGEPAVAIQTTYIVKQGDTLGAIARLYGIPEQSIIDANGIINPNLVQIGAELKIPEK